MSTWWTPGLVGYLARHPGGALSLVRAGWRLRRTNWWRQAPFLPIPDPGYWNFRMVTAYGSTGARPVPSEMVEAARWSLRQRVGQ